MTHPDSASPSAGHDWELEVLRQENAALKLRVGHLEALSELQRDQMDSILGSASWRITSPVRMSKGRVRRLQNLAKRRRRTPWAVPLNGLFPPEGEFPKGVNVDRLVVDPASLIHPIVEELPHRDAELLVVIHVYYPEMWPELADLLETIDIPFDLAVSLVNEKSEELESTIRRQFPRADVQCFPNRGRDIGPLIAFANAGKFRGYEAVLKLHTKKSPHRLDGDRWRRRLTRGLVSTSGAVRTYVDTIKNRDDVGVIVSKGNIGGPEFWGSNLAIVEALASRVPMAFEPESLKFPTGSMYFIKPWILDRLADFCLTESDLEMEFGQLDGTVAHAIERLVGIIANASGLELVETNKIGRLPPAVRIAANRPLVLASFGPQADPSAAIEPTNLKQYGALSADFGIDALTLPHYWPRQEAPGSTTLDVLLADTSIELPFVVYGSIQSAVELPNEKDGSDQDGEHEQVDWVDAFYDDISRALRDPRYLTVDGKPLLVIDRAGEIADLSQVASRLRKRAVADGLSGLHLLAVIPPPSLALTAATYQSFDGLIQRPPYSGVALCPVPQASGSQAPTGHPYSYAAAHRAVPEQPVSIAGTPVHPCVFPGWDDRSLFGDDGAVFLGANPSHFRGWLARTARTEAVRVGAQSIVVIPDWTSDSQSNELAPSARFGTSNLEAVLNVFGTHG